jgi:hypothetical protein
MRIIMVVTLATASCAFAQTRGGTIFGNMINTVPPPSGYPREPGSRGFGGGFGGFNGYGGFARPQAAHPRHENTVIVPYPVLWGPSFGGYYDSPAPPPPAYYPQEPGYPAYAQQAQPPVVIINQNFRPDTANPVVRDYSNTPLPEPTLKMYENQSRPGGVQGQPTVADDQPTVYLIAMRDHTIFPAVAYWVEGDTLNYITTQGGHNRATLAAVDREFSKQLNDERHVEFRLPAGK